MNQSNQTTMIIGAGFAGLFAALHMRCKNYKPSITLIDSQDRFVFKPMLFDALTSELAENTVCPSYQELLQNTKINFIKDRVMDVDLSQKQITLLLFFILISTFSLNQKKPCKRMQKT